MSKLDQDEVYDERERYVLYRLCACTTCDGKGKGVDVLGGVPAKCPECRGEGRVRQEIATCETPEAVGVAMVTLAREGEWLDEFGNPCAFGLLDRSPECPECGGDGKDHTDANIVSCPECKGSGKKTTGTWLLLPWRASPRQISDAGRMLATARKKS